MTQTKGFSLIELLIVVAIILIIAAIAIPNLINARMTANEASAAQSLRSLNTAEVTYAATYNSGFTDNLSRLGKPASGLPDMNNADLVDPVLAGRSSGGSSNAFAKGGYAFTYTPTGSNTSYGFIAQYQITAEPQARGSSGRRSFYTDETAVIRANSTASAAASDSPI